jgi:hypothetical protein
VLQLIASLMAILSANPQILHLRADSGVVLDANGRVSLWKDLSPRHTDFGTPTLGHPEIMSNFTAATSLTGDSLLRPRPSSNGPGGWPSIVFDGTQALVDTSSLPLDSGFTLFIVAQDSSGVGAQTALIDKGPDDFNTDLWNGASGNLTLSISWQGYIAKSSLETSATTLYESSWDGQTGQLWANGVFQDSGNWTGTHQRNKDAWLGAVLNPDSVLEGFLKGQICEVVIYAGSLDPTSRIAIENSLLAKYFHPANPQILHLRADSGVVLDANGRVSLWKDLSPRHTDFGTPTLGHPEIMSNFTAATSLTGDSLLRPRPSSNGPGGWPSIVFDGTQALVDTSSLPLDSGFTLFIVAQDSSGVGAQTALIDKGPDDFNTDLWNGASGNLTLSISWQGYIAKSSLETSATTLYESSWDGQTGQLWANGVFQDSGNWTGTHQRNKDAWLGAVLNPDSVLEGFLKGQICEVVVYAGTMTGWQRQVTENPLLARYGIQRSTASVRPAMAPSGFSVHFASGRIEVVASGNGRVYATSLNGRILGQADLVSGKAELPRFRGEVLLTVRDASGSVKSRLLVDPSR